jgi:CDP-glycerol glycerophosphotransferase (TagB/SpsB family)
MKLFSKTKEPHKTVYKIFTIEILKKMQDNVTRYYIFGIHIFNKKFTINRSLKTIQDSGYFDKEYYYFQRPDVKGAGVDALEHYLTQGWKEGVNPSLKFNNNAYLEAYPEVNMNPLLHYLLYGEKLSNKAKTRKMLAAKKKQHILSTHKENEVIEKKLKEKVKQGHKIRVTFFVVSDSIFPGKTLFELMLKDKIFDPLIVVICADTVAAGKDFLKENIEMAESTYKAFSSKYKRVYKAYSNRSFIDFSENIDMACITNPYNYIHKYYKAQYLQDAGVLSFCINYGYMGLLSWSKYFIRDVFSYNFMWKIFLENRGVEHFIQEVRPFKINNLLVTGYSKMDYLSTISRKKLERKRVIIASHHSFFQKNLYISQFLKYSDFILELPRLYTNIDFVFRPHPAVFIKLKQYNIWSPEKIDKYLQDIKAIPNMVYDNSGDYFDLFVNSDALIHDCGSFLAEYLYTDHPQCFLLKDEEDIDRQFLPFGQRVLKNVYKAFSKEQIIDFIDNVVIKEQDYMKRSREKFANKYIKINYPHATEKIIEYIKKKIT